MTYQSNNAKKLNHLPMRRKALKIRSIVFKGHHLVLKTVRQLNPNYKVNRLIKVINGKKTPVLVFKPKRTIYAFEGEPIEMVTLSRLKDVEPSKHLNITLPFKNAESKKDLFSMNFIVRLSGKPKGQTIAEI